MARPVIVGLNAVIVAASEDAPLVLTVNVPPDVAVAATAARLDASLEGLPFGPLDPDEDRTLDRGLRRWVAAQTGLPLGYIEQLYTFGDRDRGGAPDARVLSVAYLALTRQSELDGSAGPRWSRLYDFLPWEDWRHGPAPVLERSILPGLDRWADQPEDPLSCARRRERAQIVFGLHGAPWDRNRVLDRYELLYEASLVDEAVRDADAGAQPGTPGGSPLHRSAEMLGRSMALDHRRIVATALERMRGKLSYRPVVFELLPDSFTLLQLQRVVEALVGERIHKQNFRRLVEQSRMVERTGNIETRTGGRPADLFRFRRDVLLERPAPGLGLPRRRLAR